MLIKQAPLSAPQTNIFRQNKSRHCKSRAAIEPVISHLKHDHRMLRNYLKGFMGDKINAILAGAVFNFKIRLREIRSNLFLHVFECTFRLIFTHQKEWVYSSEFQNPKDSLIDLFRVDNLALNPRQRIIRKNRKSFNHFFRLND